MRNLFVEKNMGRFQKWLLVRYSSQKIYNA